MPLIEEIFSKLDSSKYPRYNKLSNFVITELGEEQASNLETALSFIADETAQVLQGGSGTTSDAKLALALKAFNKAQSPAQFAGTLKTLKTVLGARKESYTAGTYMDRAPGPNPVKADVPYQPGMPSPGPEYGRFQKTDGTIIWRVRPK